MPQLPQLTLQLPPADQHAMIQQLQAMQGQVPAVNQLLQQPLTQQAIQGALSMQQIHDAVLQGPVLPFQLFSMQQQMAQQQLAFFTQQQQLAHSSLCNSYSSSRSRQGKGLHNSSLTSNSCPFSKILAHRMSQQLHQLRLDSVLYGVQHLFFQVTYGVSCCKQGCWI